MEPGIRWSLHMVSGKVRRDNLRTSRACPLTVTQYQAGLCAQLAHLKESLRSILGRVRVVLWTSPWPICNWANKGPRPREVCVCEYTYVLFPKLPFFQILERTVEGTLKYVITSQIHLPLGRHWNFGEMVAKFAWPRARPVRLVTFKW